MKLYHSQMICVAATSRCVSEAIRRNRRNEGPLLGPADGWIAAAALMLDCPLVTHDRRLAQSPLITAITELDAQEP